MNELNASTKETLDTSLVPSAMRGHIEDGCLLTKKWALTRHQICQDLNLGLPSLQNCQQ